VRGDKHFGLVERAVGGDGEAEAGGGERVHEGSGWITSVHGEEEMRK
jgi:hypothetical protein